ncbi:MAG: UDP-N-acetylglucosamine 1-carboxyvinyltransferase [Myxococcota bacterium]
MDALRIKGGTPLRGVLDVSGSKNAALPAIAAALLAPGKSRLTRVPDLADVRTLSRLLEHMGVDVTANSGELELDATFIEKREAPYDLVRTMRASILVLGPLLSRFGRARVSLPGGCAIGARPIDQHLKGLAALGAEITIEHGYVEARCEGLKPGHVCFDMPTVTGTENLMLAAALVDGEVTLENAACEPEVVDLAVLLRTMGVEIEGEGTSTVRLHGREQLKPYAHEVVADRIELGTFIVAGALAGDPLVIRGGVPEHQLALLDVLRAAGVEITVDSDDVIIQRSEQIRPVNIETAPFPGFPTDMQAQMMTLLALSNGEAEISETIFENRFMHVAELNRLGADVRVDGGRAHVRGVSELSGTTVMATDLRASACLVLAGLVAKGETVVRRIYHLDRGYEHIESKLQTVGANIERFSE